MQFIRNINEGGFSMSLLLYLARFGVPAYFYYHIILAGLGLPRDSIFLAELSIALNLIFLYFCGK